MIQHSQDKEASHKGEVGRGFYNPDVLNCIANLSNDEVFTPPELANKMLDLLPQELFSNPKTTFLDPFTKSGVFLREIVKRLDRGLESLIPDRQKRIDHILHNQVFGIACTELTSLLARRSVYCSKHANSKYSVSKFDKEEGNILYKNINHHWVNGKCKYCGASQAVYDRGSEAEQYAYMFIHTDNPKQFFPNMKFDVIVGNPPYQLDDGGNGASAKPIYQLFIEQAKMLHPQYISIISPARWFAGGKGLDGFREIMLNDKRIKILVDYPNAKDCFPETSIGGGVCFFLWDSSHQGECLVQNIHGNLSNSMKRSLNKYDIFVRFNEAIHIIDKIREKKEQTFMSIVSSRNPFGLSSSTRGTILGDKDSYKLVTSGGTFFIDKASINQGKDIIGKYKILISKVTSEHAGEPDKEGMFRVISRMEVLPPNVVSTDSYLTIGEHAEKNIVTNEFDYLKTKFARFLMLQAISSINLSKDKFQFVPLQDFSHPWTDEMLYKKYGLTEEEIAFIESMIRPME